MAGADEESIAADTHEVESRAWTVAQLNAEIESVLEDASGRFPAYVVGEVSAVNTYGFGTFFELRDLDAEAVISCLAWSAAVSAFDHPLEEGTAAIVRAAVDFYPDRGDTQLVVSDYWPVGDSERTQALEALRSQLAEEGLFDPEHKRPLPAFPTHIGVVTSLSGSAREDFVSTVRARSPHVTVTLCGATVQGEDAVPSLVGAVRTLERDDTVEVIVVTRGGGSDTDLWCFNEEPVVRSIADCTTPTVVAVGHEDDETLAEAVADRRAMTPTDAGVATTPDMDAVRETAGLLERHVDGAYTALVEERLAAMAHRIESATTAIERRIDAREATLGRAGDLERRISIAYDTFVDDRLTALDRRIDTAIGTIEHAAATDDVTVRAARGRIDDLEARIDGAYRRRVDGELLAVESRLDRAYHDVETEARVEAGWAEVRRLRIVVAVLLALLIAGTLLVVLVFL